MEKIFGLKTTDRKCLLIDMAVLSDKTYLLNNEKINKKLVKL